METCDLQCQAMAIHLLDGVFGCSNQASVPSTKLQSPPPQQPEKKTRPQPEQALRCPRCDSTNTKFCYYNNYSLSQPRYFCKGCRRYWTKGGTLRNVPVGGGCRKNKRLLSSKKTQEQPLVTSSSAVLQSLPPPPALTYAPSDLTLAFTGLQNASAAGKLGLDDRDSFMLENTGPNSVVPHVPAFLDVLKSGFLDGSPGSFTGLYFGLGGDTNQQEVECAMGEQQQAVPVPPPFEDLRGATTAIKQESSYKSAAEDGRLFMGLQWQEGDAAGNVVADPSKDFWNGVGSTWQGLVYSSLI